MEQKQEHLLTVEGLHTSFNVPAGEVRSVSGISFSLDKGKILGIVGESGSGKSVTAASIMQILVSPGHIKSGSVVFEGEELVGMSEKDLRKKRGDKMAMIFQDPMTALNPVYTIGHQMTEAMLLHKKNRVDVLSESEARELRSENTKITRLLQAKKELKKEDPEYTKKMASFEKEEATIREQIALKQVNYDLSVEAAKSQAAFEKSQAHAKYEYEKSKARLLLNNSIRSILLEKIQEDSRFDNEKRKALLYEDVRAKQKEAISFAMKKNELSKAMLVELRPLEEKVTTLSKEEKVPLLAKEEEIKAKYKAQIAEADDSYHSCLAEADNLRKNHFKILKKDHKDRIHAIRKRKRSAVVASSKAVRDAKEAYRASYTTTKYMAKQRAIEMLKLVGVSEPEKRMKQYPFEFSGGMLQRVMIAMALLCDPDLLIADEPTTALDVTIQAQILELIKTIQKKLGMGVIIITHDLGVVAQICDEVDVMYAGRIVERGTVDEIFYDPEHEYTKGLMGSIPGQDAIKGKMLHPIEGNPVDVFALPKGCSFGPRCEKCMEICLKEYPAERQIDEHHYSSCFYSALMAMKAGKISEKEFVAYLNAGFPIDSNVKVTKPHKDLFAFVKKLKKEKSEKDSGKEAK